MVANLLLILALGVPEDIGNELGEDMLEELRGEDHLCPVVTLLHNLQHIACRQTVSYDATARVKQWTLPLKSILPSKYASWKICMGIFSFP